VTTETAFRNRPRGSLLERAQRRLKDRDALTVSLLSPTWHWDGLWTVRHARTRFPAVYNLDCELWVAGDGTPWETLAEAIAHLDWLASDLGI
jgi:hypothetical protein